MTDAREIIDSYVYTFYVISATGADGKHISVLSAALQIRRKRFLQRKLEDFN